MTLLNPLALLLIPFALYLLKGVIIKRATIQEGYFVESHKSYLMQNRALVVVLILLILSLSRPALVNEISHERFDASEYIIAIDSSFSMLSEDIRPSRFEKAKESIIKLLQRDISNRYTLYAFTSKPLLICPPTTDTAIAINALNALEPKYILTKGTSIMALLKSVATLKREHKELILFSDGGEEHNLNALLSLAKKEAITINVVAIASDKGSMLQKDGQPLKDENAHLIISRINPILEPLASGSGGFYLRIDEHSGDRVDALFSAIQKRALDVKRDEVDIIRYHELYYIPLILAFIGLLISLTKIASKLPFIPLILLPLLSPYSLKASILDFYYIKKAKEADTNREYKEASYYYAKLTPSTFSYIALGNSYYHQKKYDLAIKYYNQIRSKDPKIKQIALYNMGNVAFKLKKYDRAKEYYKQALALGFDKEAFDNLSRLYELELKSKVDVADMLPHVNDKEAKSITKKSEKKGDEQKESTKESANSQKGNTASQSGSGTKAKQEAKSDITLKKEESNYKMGYNAYELINEGYIHEKRPW